MHDIHLVLTKLSDYFVDDETEDALLERVSTLQYNINYEVLMNNLIEICTECRQTRESDVFDNTHDSWEYFTRIISIKHLIAFFTGLIELATKDASNYLHQKLAITVCRTYVLLLTSPGAKIFDAFEPPLLQRAFKIVGVLKQLAPFKEHQRVQLQIAIIMLLQDFVLYLKHVSFQNYEDLQTELIDAIAIIMEYHHENGLANKCMCDGMNNQFIIPCFIVYIFSLLQMQQRSRRCVTMCWSTFACHCTVQTYRPV